MKIRTKDRMNRVRTLYLAGVVMGLLCAGSSASTVYKSVDTEGNVSYSDQKPDTPGVVVEELALPETDTSVDLEAARERLSKITEVADRLQKRRLDEQDSKTRQYQAQQQTAPPPYPVVIEHDQHSYYPYPWGNYRRPFPSIHQRERFQRDRDRHRGVGPLRIQDRDSGPVIVPKSRLLTP